MIAHILFDLLRRQAMGNPALANAFAGRQCMTIESRDTLTRTNWMMDRIGIEETPENSRWQGFGRPKIARNDQVVTPSLVKYDHMSQLLSQCANRPRRKNVRGPVVSDSTEPQGKNNECEIGVRWWIVDATSANQIARVRGRYE
jgi:hypothetical protein